VQRFSVNYFNSQKCLPERALRSPETQVFIKNFTSSKWSRICKCPYESYYFTL